MNDYDRGWNDGMSAAQEAIVQVGRARLTENAVCLECGRPPIEDGPQDLRRLCSNGFGPHGDGPHGCTEGPGFHHPLRQGWSLTESAAHELVPFSWDEDGESAKYNADGDLTFDWAARRYARPSASTVETADALAQVRVIAHGNRHVKACRDILLIIDAAPSPVAPTPVEPPQEGRCGTCGELKDARCQFDQPVHHPASGYLCGTHHVFKPVEAAVPESPAEPPQDECAKCGRGYAFHVQHRDAIDFHPFTRHVAAAVPESPAPRESAAHRLAREQGLLDAPVPDYATLLEGLAPIEDEASGWAQRFHEAYERLAPSFGYETRKDSAVPWADVPENNRRLMEAVCAEIIPAISLAVEARVRAAETMWRIAHDRAVRAEAEVERMKAALEDSEATFAAAMNEVAETGERVVAHWRSIYRTRLVTRALAPTSPQSEQEER